MPTELSCLPPKDMEWLDSPCKADEVKDWNCNDVFVEHPSWPWLCGHEDTEPPKCGESFSLFNLGITRSTPPPLPVTILGLSSKTVSMAVGVLLVVLGGVCAGLATSRLGSFLFEFQSVSSAPDKGDDVSEVTRDTYPCQEV